MTEKLKHTLISIIMPAYNAELYIQEAVNSVVHQTYGNWELIIVDDGSTDNTAAVITTHFSNDNRIKYYYQQNGKQGKARNHAISKSNGDYLAFLDADDLWIPEKLEFQLAEIMHKNVDLVFSNCSIFQNDSSSDIIGNTKTPTEVYYNKDSIPFFLQANRVPILIVLVKKDKILNVNGFSEDEEIQNVEDYHLWLKLLMSDCVFFASKQVVAKYREHNNSATSSDKLVLSKLPYMYFDLMKQFSNYSEQIKNEIKIKLKLYYKNNIFTKKELKSLIIKNTTYLSKSNYLYLLLNFFMPTKITKRIIIHILNK